MYYGIRVTAQVNQALSNAASIAYSYGNMQIGTEHLLYGLCSVKESATSKMLNNAGVTLEGLTKIFDRNSTRRDVAVTGQIDLTPRCKEIFALANQFASQIGHEYIGTEHVFVSLLLSSDSYAVGILKRAFGVDIEAMKASVLRLLKSDAYRENMNSATFETNTQDAQAGSELDPRLLEMGQDLTLKAKQGKIDPIIGREEETNRLIDILCRKTKNNPVLIGEAGVGKSAVVDGLALKIVHGDVPDILKDKIIFSLELGGLMAGTKYRGDLEEKLKNLIECIKNNKRIIVFIDEIHTLMQAGGDKGEVNPADMLKPYLARGEFQTIGATTTEEYRKFIEKDRALERRFQPVMINPPSVDDTIKILKGIRPSYEKFHNVTITDEAIVAAATLSDRYIMDRSLPDKAIDLIDEACSRAKVRGVKKPVELEKLEEEISKLEQDKKNALMKEDFATASACRDKLKYAYNLQDQIRDKYKMNSNISIYEEDISEIISKWTGIPVTKITDNEKERLMHMEDILHRRVIGQDEAINAVCRAIRRNRIGLKDNNRPIGSFMFLGQTGVGKTELCKALAEAVFDNEKFVIRLDMSEYMEKHSVSKLIGSPPGYVGFDEGGQLTEAVRKHPYSVVLFDEIEKAHPDVFNMLLQILDDGRLTDSQGRTVSFKNTIIIMTSNVGCSQLPKATKLGFNMSGSDEKALDYETIKNTLITAFKQSFKPEFVNRIDVVTVFHPLNYKQLAQIAKIFISNLNKRLVKNGVSLKVTESALKYLIEKGYDPEYGARPLRRLIEQEIEDKIAEGMLSGSIEMGSVVVISARGDKLVLRIDKPVMA